LRDKEELLEKSLFNLESVDLKQKKRKKMPIIFKATTHEAHTIKSCADLLQNNIKTACFEIDNNGIKLCMIGQHRKVLINLHLERENFTLYKFKAQESMFIGLNLSQFYKMLRSIKKKDSLQLYLDSDEPNDLCIKHIPNENNRITTSFIKIQHIQNIQISLPEGYRKHIIIPSSDFTKMIKDMACIDGVIGVKSAKSFHIQFVCANKGVVNRQVDLGEVDEDDSDDDDDVYDEEFDRDQLSRVTKIAGLGINMQIFVQEGLPLMFRSNVGSLGKISIYIKSKKMIEKESCELEENADSV
jgi:proliferating cell nuclear antigen PCNA